MLEIQNTRALVSLLSNASLYDVVMCNHVIVLVSPPEANHLLVTTRRLLSLFP